MLLSDPAIEKLLQEDFVPSWESVHDTAKVTIDFADGQTLKRTIGGNTVIYLCRADGAVADAFPGIYTKDDFLSEAKPALDLLMSGLAFATDARLIDLHKNKRRANQAAALSSLSKSIVESPVLLRVNTLGSSAPLRDISKEPRASRDLIWVSAPRKANPTKQTPKQFGQKIIRSDSANNRDHVRPRIHLMLSELAKPPMPKECTVQIYEGILGTRLNDPYLGLTDAELPGTSGLTTR